MSARRLHLLLMSAVIAGGCAAPQQGGRVRLAAPEEVSVAYSEIELQTSLAIAAGTPCVDDGCSRSIAFREQLRRVGQRLASAAHAVFPERPGLRFEFSVASRGQLGTLSNASGHIVLLDGLAAADIDDAALAFIVAREMGHVVERHHDENSALSILVSIAVHLVLPVANLIPSSSLAGLGTSTAASLAGSRALKQANRPDQRDEADSVALRLLTHAGWDLDEVVRAIDNGMPRLKRGDDDGWLAELRLSKARLDQFDCGIVAPQEPDVLMTALEAHENTRQSISE